MKQQQQIVLAILTMAWSACVACAGGDTGFTYQGRLLDAGQPANGLFNIQFGLWDDPVAGFQVGSTNTFDSLPIAEGLFTVELDFGAAAFDNNARWLEIMVDGVPMLPRQPVTRAPYSIQTRGIFVNDLGDVGIGTTDPQTLLHVGQGYAPTVGGITAQVAGGIAAQHDLISDGGNILSRSPEGANAAVLSLDASAGPGGKTWSLISNAENSPYGAPEGSLTFFNSQTGQHVLSLGSDGNVAIGTENPDPSYALHVESYGIAGGVYGRATTTTNVNAGVYGRTDSPVGRGVQGFASDTNGVNLGVFGRSLGTNGVGVYGDATNDTGTNYGVYGTAESTEGTGVFGHASNTSGTNYGVRAETNSPNGYAGYFEGGRNYFEGNIGIGTEDPTERMHISGGADNDGTTASLRITTGSASILMDGNEIDTVGSALYLNHNNPNDVYLGTAGGYVGVGTNSPSAALQVDGPAAVNALRVRVDGTTRLLVSDTGGVSGGVVIGANTNPQYELHLATGNAGKPGGGLWAATSDRRLKKNVQQLDGALQQLLELRGVTFQYNDPQAINETPGKHIGLIAQEVQPVFPEWVHEAPDGYLRVSEKGLTALTVEALRELRDEKNAEIAALRTEKDREIEQLRAANERMMVAQNREIKSLRAQNEELQLRFTKLESLVLQHEAENN